MVNRRSNIFHYSGKKWFVDNNVMSSWSGWYPDLNPIENYWADLKNCVAEDTPLPLDALKEVYECVVQENRAIIS